MATFEDLTQEVLLELDGFLDDDDIYGTITAELTAGATTFTIAGATYADGSGFGPGVMEIGDELLYVRAFDRSTGIATSAFRGWKGTTDATHASGSIVRSAPRFPRISVQRAINDVIENVYPALWVPTYTTITYSGNQVRYDLPTDCEGILEVTYNLPGSSGVWTTCSNWRFIRRPGGESAGNHSIDLVDCYSGRTAQIVYYKRPTALSSSSDVFDTVTGLEDYMRPVIIYGAVAKLLGAVNLPKATSSYQQGAFIGNEGSAEVGDLMLKNYLGLYAQALEDAGKRLRMDYPGAKTLTWW